MQTIEKLQLLLAANRSARSELVKRCAVETGAILSAIFSSHERQRPIFPHQS